MPTEGILDQLTTDHRRERLHRTEDVTFDRSGLDATPTDPVDRYATGKLRLWHDQQPFGDSGPGRFAILCDNFVAFEKPVPYRGAQGLFDVELDLTGVA